MAVEPNPKSLSTLAKEALSAYFHPIQTLRSALTGPSEDAGARLRSDRTEADLSRDTTEDKLLEAEKRAGDIVNRWVVGATVVGWIPGSMVSLRIPDSKMITDVAEAFGVKDASAEAVYAMVRTSRLSNTVGAEALSLIPVIGWAIKAHAATALAKTIGEKVIAYFRARSPYTKPASSGNNHTG